MAYIANGQTEDIEGFELNYLWSATISEYQHMPQGGVVNEAMRNVELNDEN